MQFKLPLILLGLIPALTTANPMPVTTSALGTDSEALNKRALPDCSLNYIPACCTFVTWTSYPYTSPGLSSGCVPMPATGCTVAQPNTRACCEEHYFTSGKLWYQPNGKVWCIGGV
ncbi:hypothetical protein BGX38DRAFT_1214211 [Terfezia claveryi]|nr:hypothetical protein BGX38DRAFT_1214211 [Terfezia claveryi]